jgi:hypothetical protein
MPPAQPTVAERTDTQTRDLDQASCIAAAKAGKIIDMPGGLCASTFMPGTFSNTVRLADGSEVIASTGRPLSHSAIWAANGQCPNGYRPVKATALDGGWHDACTSWPETPPPDLDPWFVVDEPWPEIRIEAHFSPWRAPGAVVALGSAVGDRDLIGAWKPRYPVEGEGGFDPAAYSNTDGACWSHVADDDEKCRNWKVNTPWPGNTNAPPSASQPSPAEQALQALAPVEPSPLSNLPYAPNNPIPGTGNAPE